MLTITIFLCVLLVILAIVYQKSKKVSPPGPITLPYIGLFPFILIQNVIGNRKNLQNRFFKTMKQKYGSIWCYKSNNQRFIVLNDSDLIKEAFQNHGIYLSGRPRTVLHHYITKYCGLLSSDGELWKYYRSITSKSLHEIGRKTRNFEEIIELKFRTMFESNSNKFQVSSNEFFYSMTLTIILKIIFNLDYKYDDELIDRFLQNISVITTASIPLNDSLFHFIEYGWLRPLLPYTFQLKDALDGNVEIITQFYQKMLAKDPKDAINEENFTSIAECYLQEKLTKSDSKSHQQYLTDFIQIQNFYDLISAGSDTTAATLSWSCFILTIKSHILLVLRDEINTNFPDSNYSISYKDRAHLPTVCSFIEEIHRYHTIVPYTMHRPILNLKFHGFEMTPTDIIIADNQTVNMDSKLWRKPDQFLYDRFMDTANNKLISYPDHLVPFGIGKRKCIGEELARIEVFVILCFIIKNYNIELILDTGMDVDDIMNNRCGLVNKPSDFDLKFTRV